MADSVLIIDDDADVLRSIGSYFEQLGYEVSRELNGEAGLSTYDRLRPEVVVVDLGLPGMDGLEVLVRLKERNAAVILLTGQGDVETAVRAMQMGAENFLVKPIDMAHLVAAVGRVADKVRLRRLNEMLLLHAVPGEGLEHLGSSPAMKDLARQLGLLAHSDRTSVLLLGENGVGKSWVASMIHKLSPRNKFPFVQLHCGGTNVAALETELFGQENSGTGAGAERREGLLELAGGGTVFLEEIGGLPPELQPRLLKVLETRAFRRVGGVRDIAVDVRLVASSSRDLAAEVESAGFNEDLYYRLSVMPITLPPMRDRPREDRLSVLLHLFNELQAEAAGGPQSIGQEALERLLAYAWPGNIREMRNVLERSLILARGQQFVNVEHLPGEFRARPGVGDRRHTPQTLDELERQHIERTLRHHNGNRTRAAHELGISRATLINKIKRYSIQL
jgi:DNA-binding NtrC family response regulator